MDEQKRILALKDLSREMEAKYPALIKQFTGLYYGCKIGNPTPEKLQAQEELCVVFGLLAAIEAVRAATKNWTDPWDDDLVIEALNDMAISFDDASCNPYLAREKN